MANNRDVNLTVKAKNAASDTIKEVTEALRALRGEQKNSTSEASRSTSVMARLGSEYRNLTGQAEKMKAASKVAENIRQMAGAVERLGNTQRAAADEMTRVNGQMAQAQAKSKALTDQQRALTEQYDRLGAETKALKDEKKKLLANMDEEAKLYGRINREAKKAEKGRSDLSFGSTAASSASVFMGNEIGDMRMRSLDLADKIAENERLMKGWKAETSELKKEITATGREIDKLDRDVEKTTGAFDRATASWKEAGDRLTEVQNAARQRGLQGLIEDQERLERETRQTVEEMERMERVMASFNRFSNGEGGFTDPRAAAALQQQIEKVDEARGHYQRLSEQHKRLSADVRAGIAPQSQAARAAREMGEAAEMARRELAEQEKILRQMPGSARAAGGALGGMFRGYNAQGRTALSLTQRLRAEVLSLILAYGGLHSAIALMNDVVGAYQKMEAAQNRLMVVVGGSNQALGNELGFLNRQAARLGIDFSILSDEYSKFAVAANAANFSGENTRRIFMSVAEAGRVNKLSMEQMSGVFLALQQMISKGKVSSEELRRQMGDRLPGAFNIFADAVGMTTAELDKAMKAGEVFSDQDTMLKFAEELEKRFGPQLSESLRTTTTLIGQFTNELFQAKLRIGEGGFIDALNDALKEMISYFRSREGRDFFLNLGAAMGKVVSIIPFIVENFGAIAALIRTLVAFKMVQWLSGMVMGFGSLDGSLSRFRAGLRLARIEMAAGRGAIAALTAAFGGLRAAMMALPGGIILAGLSIGLSALMGSWFDGVDDVTQKVDEHNRIMGEVLGAYEEAKNKAGDWRDAIPKGIDLSTSESNFTSQLGVFEDRIDEFSKNYAKAMRNVEGSIVNFDVRKFRAEMARMKSAFDINDIESYIDALKEYSKNITSLDQKSAINEMIEWAKGTQAARDRMVAAARVAVEMGTSLDKAMEIVDQFGTTMEDLVKPIEEVKKETVEFLGRTNDMWAMGEQSVDGFREKMEELAKFVPELAAKMEELDERSKLENLRESLGWLAKIPQLAALFDQAFDKIDIGKIFEGSESGPLGASAALLKSFEGFSEAPYWDVNADRIGYGSDTVTLADGSVKKVVRGMRVSVEDANRDLYRRIGEFQSVIKGQIGADRFASFDDKQQAALTSIAYNYGSLPNRILSAVRNGTASEIATAIQGLSGDNNGVNAGRRAKEAAIFGQGGSFSDAPYVASEEARQKAAEKAKEEAAEAAERTKQTIADNQFAIEQQNLINAGKERQAAIEAAIREAKADNPNIGEAELEQIKAQAAALWDKENALSSEEQKKKLIAEHNERINQLETQRNALLEQRKMYEEQGDQTKLDAVDQRLVQINSELAAAYDGAIAFWQGIGGGEADAAIAKLELAKQKLTEVQQKTLITGQEINNRLADGMVGAFDSMAQAIANGENALAAFGQAFRQFAAEFLLEIGKMILKQALLNALQGAGGAGGGVGGFIAGAIAKIFHAGGVVGSGSAPSRAVSSAWFSNAARYHNGGTAGLAPNEVPAILEKGEEVLPENDPRHIANFAGGGRGGKGVNLKVVNAVDGTSALEQALSAAPGEEVMLNFIQAHIDEITSMQQGS